MKANWVISITGAVFVSIQGIAVATDLEVARSGNQLVFSWSQESTNDFYLQYATNLDSQTVWSNTDDPSPEGQKLYVTNQAAFACGFYRLQAWEYLFDGTSTKAFRGYRQSGFPGTNQWRITDLGELMAVANASPINIVTTNTYGSYELRWEWRTAAGGNSGVKYQVDEDYVNYASAGPEYQLQDDSPYLFPSNQNMGAAYKLFAPVDPAASPVGDWNECRLVIRGDSVQHWLNGRKIVDYEINGPAWTNALAAAGSPYNVAGFGQGTSMGRGHILFQNMLGPSWFRNIKIRPL